MKKKFSVSVVVTLIISFIVIIILGSSIFKTLNPGEKAVIFRKFSGGLDKDHIFDAGFHVIAPWNDWIVYDVREQALEFEPNTAYNTLDVLDKSGLSIHVDVTVRFHPIFSQIGYLHEKFGTNYINKLIIPIIRSAARKVMGHYTSEEIYSTKRTMVESEIIKVTSEELKSNNIEMTALLIRSIILPDNIKKAIEMKQTREQEANAMKFVNQKEELEAERKRIEAEGQARANAIVNSSLTKELLKMKGIEATIELSKSPNAKVVVIGNGADGMPLILGNN